MEFLRKDLQDSTDLPEGGNVNIEEAKKIRKKLVILGISVLKVLGLYDHNENKFVNLKISKKSFWQLF